MQGGQRNAHGAGVVNRLLSYCGYFFQVHHTFWQQHRHHGHRRGSYRLSWNKQEMQKRCLRCNRPAYRRQHICKNFKSMEPLKQELAEYLDYDAFCGAQRQPGAVANGS